MEEATEIKVGLVLGAGGVVGASWLVGALQALVAETGWDPAAATRIVGTSAGSVIASLCAAGVAPAEQAAHIAGESLPQLDSIGRDALDGSDYRLARALPSVGPGSLRLALTTLRRPLSHTPAALLGGWIPRGFISTDPISDLVNGFVRADWPSHSSLWTVACDYDSGRRVVFGRDGAPVARIGEAVAASCAIPGFYHPVTIAGRRYVDGGLCSMSNLDVLAGQGLDLVVCLNPTSSADSAGGGPAGRVADALRGSFGRRLAREAAKLEDEGTAVVTVQPCAADLRVMGANLMARRRRVEVLLRARENVARQLEGIAGLSRLPATRRLRPVAAARRPAARSRGRRPRAA